MHGKWYYSIGAGALKSQDATGLAKGTQNKGQRASTSSRKGTSGLYYITA